VLCYFPSLQELPCFIRSTLNIVDFDDGDTSNLVCVRFQVITAASMKFRVFWDIGILPCSQIDVGRHGSDYTAVYPRTL
jgi:hypothetical protein